MHGDVDLLARCVRDLRVQARHAEHEIAADKDGNHEGADDEVQAATGCRLARDDDGRTIEVRNGISPWLTLSINPPRHVRSRRR